MYHSCGGTLASARRARARRGAQCCTTGYYNCTTPGQPPPRRPARLAGPCLPSPWTRSRSPSRSPSPAIALDAILHRCRSCPRLRVYGSQEGRRPAVLKNSLSRTWKLEQMPLRPARLEAGRADGLAEFGTLLAVRAAAVVGSGLGSGLW
ncbi:hypothetical protein PLESTB_000329800 [Pleodorina starrii]|uniref:Uncharacterized protein n=1 Tax=Pleodorina starrii TaxID=330485 RepID=A0A9W6BDB1_9CHLO|nr:hypothetical protein PLESTB_000329800 [Pleodorina starrii]